MAGPADERIRVLCVAPDERSVGELSSVLDQGGLAVDARTDPAACREGLPAGVDCVVSTYRLDGTDGVALLRDVREEHPDLPFVLVAADGDESVASDAVRAGATDYVPVDDDVPPALADRVASAVDRADGARDARVREVYERVSDAFYAVDEEFRFTYVNEYAEELLQADAEDLLGERVWDEYPEAAETEAYDAFHEALETQQPTSYELYFEPLGFWVDARVYPSETGLSVYFRDVTEHRKREQTLRDAYEVIADSTLPFQERAERLLEIVRDALGTEYATLSRVRTGADEYVFETVAAPEGSDLQAGDTTALSSLPNCRRVVETEQTLVLRDVEAEAPELVDPEWGISCYLGAPIVVDGEVYGTFCFYGTEPRSEGFSDWETTFVELLSNWVAYELERERTAERLTALNHLNETVHDINRALVRQSTRSEIEAVVCERLAESDSYEFAWIGVLDEETREIVPSASADVRGYLDGITVTADDSPTGQGPTGTALRTGTTQVVRNVADAPEYEPWREHARERGISATASIPITYESESYGVLNVYTTREDGFSGEEQAVVSQLGDIVGLAIAATEREQRLRENERRYRTLAENIPRGSIALFDTDLRIRTAAGRIYDDLPIGPEDIRGNRATEIEGISDELGSRLEQAHRAALDGESRNVQVEVGGRILDIQIVPILDEDDDVTGGMTFLQDVTERRERERQVEYERERLEFLNRLVRHNLLNDLNAVQAHVDFLDRYLDPEADEHLETVRERTDDMIDLVTTLRSLMQVIVAEEEHELEPVDLGEVLRDEIERVRESTERAEFVLRSDDIPPVLADDLLGEMIENLLTNAVQHNNKETPRVTIDVEADGDTALIHVADNGPGVPDRVKDDLFEKGKKDFRSSGTGFGLYLVREIVEGYGGTITVADNDPTGAVFSIELPLA